MTEQEASDQLKELRKLGDVERAHVLADKILIEFLKSQGFKNVVKEYVEVPKWYS